MFVVGLEGVGVQDEVTGNFTKLFLSFHHVLNVMFSFLGNSPASEF